MDRKKAEDVLIVADEVADLVMHGFDLTMDTADGRALYARTFTAYVHSEVGDVPMSELYDALQGARG
ncbi:hypothetical protein [Paraburkholderia dinghuensis]|uniref:Uncharacterized protein n=1 Tax=Paraburkholderia dinghuensis TaxID=2305225 RepID=A0A3N6NBI4_9BURK|nr:hypothetical protein [Paraburkholderia dinghuensis]RQH05747.1 hypothetical protein D1Y85_14105 [Paraburkholderia dinghuensis]